MVQVKIAIFLRINSVVTDCIYQLSLLVSPNDSFTADEKKNTILFIVSTTGTL